MAQKQIKSSENTPMPPVTVLSAKGNQYGTDDAFGAANNAYQQLLKIGNTQQTALVLATIAYLQRNPLVPMSEARTRVAAMVGAIS